MTLPTTGDRVVYAGNGATTVFNYAFKILNAGDVRVSIFDTTGAETVLNTAQYSITGIGSDAGGAVTYPAASYAAAVLANGWKLMIERVTVQTQLATLPNQGSLLPAAIEAAIDRVVAIVQEQAQNISRAILLNPQDAVPPTLVPAAQRANMALLFDANGNPIVGASAAFIAISAALTPVVQAASIAAARALLCPAADKVLGNSSYVTGTGAIDFANTASGRMQTGTIAVAGAAVGDKVLEVTTDGNAKGLGGFLTAWVSAVNTVTVGFFNPTAGAIDPVAQNYTAVVLKASTLT